MPRQLEFFFDFMSPPTYLAWARLPAILERTGASVVWRPMLTLGLFELTGNRSPRTVPNKAVYGQADLARFARRYGVTLNANPHMETLKIVPPLRGALIALEREEFPAYARAMFDGMWVAGENIGAADVWPRLIAAAGLDPEVYREGVERQDIKDQLRANTEEAAARGAFGAPTFFVGETLFWGQDRLDFVEEALMELPA
ncbi:MAG: 2-hydroxychromene-2-carboxylate isomerase [Gammaproteobacteria bacterium]|nr:2-hydroxychromene-2-carboxylate isomerase [Gammaproteobacteria bacterium]